MPRLAISFVLLLAAPVLAQLGRSHAEIRGRCVGENGEPVAGCGVRVTAHQATGYELGWALMDWFDPEPAVTGSDGRFRVIVDAPAGRENDAGYPPRVHLAVRHDRYVTLFGQCAFPRLFEMGIWDLGDVRMPRGARPAVRVVDIEGRPVAGVVVEARVDAPRTEAETAHPHFEPAGVPQVLPVLWHYVRSADTGLVQWEDPFAVGRWQITVREYPTKGDPLSIQVELDEHELHTLAVEVPDRDRGIAGRIVDAAGRPVRDVALGARMPGHDEPVTYARSGSDGAFRFLPGPAPSGVTSWDEPGRPAELMVQRNQRCDGWGVLAAAEWGDSGVEVVVPEAVDGVVEVQGGDAPVEEFAVWWVPSRVESPLAAPVRTRGRYRGGRATVAGLAPGQWTVEVQPRSREWAASGPIRVDLAKGSAPPRVHLQATLPHTVVLRLENGAPVVGSQVDLVLIDDAMPADGSTMPLSERGPRDRITRVLPRLAARGFTDAQGRVTLRVPRSKLHLQVRALGPGHVPFAHVLDATERAETFALTVPPSAQLSGRVAPLAAIDRLDAGDPDEALTHAQWGLRANAFGKSLEDYRRTHRPGVILEIGGVPWRDRAFPFDERGEFDAGDVPAGRCRIRLVTWTRQDNRTIETVHEPALAELTLAADEHRQVELMVPEPLRD